MCRSMWNFKNPGISPYKNIMCMFRLMKVKNTCVLKNNSMQSFPATLMPCINFLLFLLDNVSGRIKCKLGPISCFMAISQSEELRQVRQLVNFVDEIEEKNIFLNLYFFPLDNVSGRIECKLGPISCFIAFSQSEELRQFINIAILTKLTKKIFF